LASVITPVHNVDIFFFEQAFRSLAAQTAGFDNIEWLVAVHNMNDEYISSLKRITGERPNIIMFAVNEGNTVSIPRNRALDRSTGEFVFFLDADDMMSEHCIATAVNALRETGADTVIFNYEQIIEDGAVDPGRFVFNAPDKPVVIYDKGDPRILSLMDGCGAEIWCRGYRGDFLRNTGVHFDEKIWIGDTFKFNLEATPYCGRVCALPQERLYCYRIRPGSLIQSTIQNTNKLEGYYQYLRYISSYGMAEMTWSQLGWFARVGLMGDRQESILSSMKAELKQVMDELRVMAPRYAYTEERILNITGFCRTVFGEHISMGQRFRHREERLEYLLLKEEVTERVKEAALENIELRTVGEGTGSYSFLGMEKSDAVPEVNYIDIRSMDAERQKKHMEAYRNIELLRGFKNAEEVRCRITVFRVSVLSCRLSVFWDERFIGIKGIERLIDRVSGNMDKYYPMYESIPEMLWYRNMTEPDRVVFSYSVNDELKTVTGSKLWKQIRKVEAALITKGITGGRCAILGKNSYNIILLYLTLIKMGITAVFIDPGFNEKEIGKRLSYAGVSAVFADADVIYALEGSDICRLCTAEITDYIEDRDVISAAEDAVYRNYAFNKDKEALILFTSGTTGYGKAAVLTYGNLMYSARNSVCYEKYERCILNLPLYHICAHQNLMSYLFMGSAVCISNCEPDVLTKDCMLMRPQFMCIVPRMLKMMQVLVMNLDEQECRKYFGGALKAVYTGGASLNYELVSFFGERGIYVGNLYGSSETLGIAWSDYSRGEQGDKMIPIRGVDIRIAEDGEILVKSDTSFKGYLGDKEATSKILDNGWIHTGDIGKLDDITGAVTITGRKKNLIIFSNGEKVSPEELEQMVDNIEEVSECLVFGDEKETINVNIYPDEKLRNRDDEYVLKVMEKRISALNDSLPKWMKIGRINLMPEPLERNNIGKLKR
jgi:long-chain acyl-CoA synthetase